MSRATTSNAGNPELQQDGDLLNTLNVNDLRSRLHQQMVEYQKEWGQIQKQPKKTNQSNFRWSGEKKSAFTATEDYRWKLAIQAELERIKEEERQRDFATLPKL